MNQPLLKTLPCQPGDFEVCQIKPSTMYFTQSKMAALENAGHDRLVSVSQVNILTIYFYFWLVRNSRSVNVRLCVRIKFMK